MHKTLLSMAVIALLSGLAFGKEPQALQAPMSPRSPNMAANMNCDRPPMLEHLKKRLNLNADQESALFDAMRQHCETMKASSQKMHDTMKHVLSAEQQAQLETMHSERGPRGEQGEHRHGDHHGDRDEENGKQ